MLHVNLRVKPVEVVQWNLPERPPLISDHLTKILIGSSTSQIAISETSCMWPPLISDHLTKILIGSSTSQIAISETSCMWPPLLSDHLTKILIGSSTSQIAISETSHMWPPPVSDHLTKIPISSSASQIAISETSHMWPPLLSDHLTKIPISSSTSQIAISETSHKRPPPVSDHLTKILISSSAHQIAISETSHKWPPKPDIKGGCLWYFPVEFSVGQNLTTALYKLKHTQEILITTDCNCSEQGCASNGEGCTDSKGRGAALVEDTFILFTKPLLSIWSLTVINLSFKVSSTWMTCWNC